eukprot:6197533-Pleurochrysis_carterae.AAC.1
MVTDFACLWEAGEISMYVEEWRWVSPVGSYGIAYGGGIALWEARLRDYMGVGAFWEGSRHATDHLAQAGKHGMRTGLGKPMKRSTGLSYFDFATRRLPKRTLHVCCNPCPTAKTCTDTMWEATAAEPAGLGIVEAYFSAHSTRSSAHEETQYEHASIKQAIHRAAGAAGRSGGVLQVCQGAARQEGGALDRQYECAGSAGKGLIEQAGLGPHQACVPRLQRWPGGAQVWFEYVASIKQTLPTFHQGGNLNCCMRCAAASTSVSCRLLTSGRQAQQSWWTKP